MNKRDMFGGYSRPLVPWDADPPIGGQQDIR
jgi:hypothetical protein